MTSSDIYDALHSGDPYKPAVPPGAPRIIPTRCRPASSTRTCSRLFVEAKVLAGA